MSKLCRYVASVNQALLTEREGRIAEYCTEVVAVRTERSEVRTKTAEGQYSQVRLELVRLVSSLLYGTRAMLVWICRLSKAKNTQLMAVSTETARMTKSRPRNYESERSDLPCDIIICFAEFSKRFLIKTGKATSVKTTAKSLAKINFQIKL